jgi:hypothetical protein
MHHYLCILSVKFKERTEIPTPKFRTSEIPDTETIFVIGYLRNMVVAAESIDQVHQLVAAEITDGAIDWGQHRSRMSHARGG